MKEKTREEEEIRDERWKTREDQREDLKREETGPSNNFELKNYHYRP